MLHYFFMYVLRMFMMYMHEKLEEHSCGYGIFLNYKHLFSFNRKINSLQDGNKKNLSYIQHKPSLTKDWFMLNVT